MPDPKHDLPVQALSSRELLLLLEMCLDAEDRCARRQSAALENGDHAAAGAAADLGATYSDLKVRLFRAMRDSGTSTEDVQATLQQLRRDIADRVDIDKPDSSGP